MTSGIANFNKAVVAVQKKAPIERTPAITGPVTDTDSEIAKSCSDAGAVIDQVVTVVTTAPAKTVQKTVEKTVELTATVTESAAVPTQAVRDGSSSANGDYIVGSDIAVGTYKCNSPSDTIYWETTSTAGDIVDNDLGSIARVVSNAFAVKLSGCNSDWTRTR